MPAVFDGVMLVAMMVPIGVGSGRPPANGLPPGAVWQATQSPAVARYCAALEQRGVRVVGRQRGAAHAGWQAR